MQANGTEAQTWRTFGRVGRRAGAEMLGELGVQELRKGFSVGREGWWERRTKLTPCLHRTHFPSSRRDFPVNIQKENWFPTTRPGTAGLGVLELSVSGLL